MTYEVQISHPALALDEDLPGRLKADLSFSSSYVVRVIWISPGGSETLFYELRIA